MHGDAARWQNTIEKGVRSVFPGVTEVVAYTGAGCYPPREGLVRLIDGMKGLKADELLLELERGKLLVVKYDYGELAAAVFYEADVSPADLSRLIQLMFARGELRICERAPAPAAEVEKIIKRWKYRIGLVFGKEFASKLVENSLKGKDKGRMTVEDLEEARAVVSSALGDCLALDKVNK